MKSRYLLPHAYKKIGGILLLLFIAFYLVLQLGFNIKWLDANNSTLSIDGYTDEVVVTGLIISLLMIAFSKEKNEDEFIATVRLESLQWGIYISYGLLVVATWSFYGLNYFSVMVYNMFTPLIFFIIRFHYVIIKNRRTLPS
ncbi:hypothetical protein ACTJJ0_08005 [Chitinophaga sp. 22321]|uniref:Uncharacterized protein n=1 Tax=Chitinophaga hostae TaxID=2831022 RepID=A0ABS5ITK8_9BACT|nr:hypothetical protein [Chitinophaga hostae]MBS0026302.1 hypothetical protein [Chitinophaga hostae]